MALALTGADLGQLHSPYAFEAVQDLRVLSPAVTANGAPAARDTAASSAVTIEGTIVIN
jgi:hypothetical protein